MACRLHQLIRNYGYSHVILIRDKCWSRDYLEVTFGLGYNPCYLDYEFDLSYDLRL